MSKKPLSEFTDQELIGKAKKVKSSPFVDAFFIGFLVGIVIYSFINSSWGFLTLIPLFMIYVLLKKPKRLEALRKKGKIRFKS